jgi:hypothetical protein
MRLPRPVRACAYATSAPPAGAFAPARSGRRRAPPLRPRKPVVRLELGFLSLRRDTAFVTSGTSSPPTRSCNPATDNYEHEPNIQRRIVRSPRCEAAKGPASVGRTWTLEFGPWTTLADIGGFVIRHAGRRPHPGAGLRRTATESNRTPKRSLLAPLDRVRVAAAPGSRPSGSGSWPVCSRGTGCGLLC